MCIESTSFFDMQNWKIYLLLWLCLKWWGTIHIKYAGFLSKWLQLLYEGREKKIKLLLLFLPLLCLWCVYMSTEINWRDKHGHQHWLSFSAHGRHNYKGLPIKKSPILLFANLALWMQFHPNMKLFMFTTKWDSKCNLHMTSWCF